MNHPTNNKSIQELLKVPTAFPGRISAGVKPTDIECKDGEIVVSSIDPLMLALMLRTGRRFKTGTTFISMEKSLDLDIQEKFMERIDEQNNPIQTTESST